MMESKHVTPPPAKHSASYRRKPISSASEGWAPAFAGVTRRAPLSLTSLASLPGSSGQSICRLLDYPLNMPRQRPGAGNDTRRAAFSLVELSIVLVILGLLTGGILTGQNLIRAAEMRAQISQITEIQTAMKTFQMRFFALPGDMPNAHEFWGWRSGYEHAPGSNCALGFSVSAGQGWRAAPYDKSTCNGNGDGLVKNHEQLLAWQHLVNAGLMTGQFKGGSHNHHVGPVRAEIEVPAAKMSRRGDVANGSNREMIVSINSHDYIAASSEWGQDMDSIIDTRRSLVIGTVGWAGASQAVYGGFLPEELWQIDTKLDDGLPNSGSIITNRGFSNRCYSGNEYNVRQTGISACTLWLLDAF